MLKVHVLGHLWEAAVLSWREARGSWTWPVSRWRRWRTIALGVSLMSGVGAVTCW